MRLQPGTRLGPYEITGPLGAGGMGEVYRARDTRLGRDVAVKTLPATFTADPEWRQRLDREARAISALSHPGICHLYDVGHHDGMDYLVMEYLEGETLAARLARGPLPLDQVLRHGVEIAAALQAAHRRGIVHRDLKPGNVMLTRSGARLLDFGLAKPSALGPLDLHGTVTAPLTAAGTLVGTYHYMSPEQAEGREVDARSDIFSLGAVLYEMATGRRAFEGRTAASVIAAVLERQPEPISSVQPVAPVALDDLVRGCLAKDPEDRWQTAHDVRLQLEAIARHQRQGAAPARAAGRPAMAAIALLALLLALGAWGVGRYTAPVPAESGSLRASLLPPPGHSFTPHDFALSPDGRRLAYVATAASGVSSLWVQSLDASQPTEISGSAGAASPFWSPDGRHLAFFTVHGLFRVEPGSGGLQQIAEVTLSTRGGAWSPDGTILFSRAVYGPVFRVPASGGSAVPATRIPSDMAGEAHRFPQFLTDGRRFLYTASWTTAQRGGVYLAGLDDDEPKLVSGDIHGRVVLVDDTLLFARGGIVYAQPFDQRRGQLTGSPVAVIRQELTSDAWRFGDLALSAARNGVLVYQSRHAYAPELVWYDRAGAELETLGPPNQWAPALSPDGTRVATLLDRTGSGQQNILVHDLQRKISTQLTTDGIDTALRWSPDGRLLAYSSIRRQYGLFRRPSDGSGVEEQLEGNDAHLLLNDYTRDGRILYMDFRNGLPQIRTYDAAAGRSEILRDGAEAAVSPDGQWLAYLGFPAATLYLTSAARPDAPRVQISAGSGSQPRWRRDGRELYYIAPDKKMMSVSLTIRDGQVEPSPPVPLFQTRIVQPRLVLFQYDVTADGQRFLVNSLPREGTAAPLTVLSNWKAAVQ